MQIFIVIVFSKLKSNREHHEYHRNYGKFVKLWYLTHLENSNSNLWEILAFVYSTNLALLTFPTIVVALKTFLTCAGQQTEQIIAHIQPLWRGSTEVLNTYATSSLDAHNSCWCQLSSREISTIQTFNLKVKITSHTSCKDGFDGKLIMYLN